MNGVDPDPSSLKYFHTLLVLQILHERVMDFDYYIFIDYSLSNAKSLNCLSYGYGVYSLYIGVLVMMLFYFSLNWLRGVVADYSAIPSTF